MSDFKKYFWLDIFLTLLKWKKFILINVVIVAFAAALLSLLLPNWYRGEATILPPDSQVSTLGLGASLSNMIGNLELPSLAIPSDIISSIAKSRSVAESVIMQGNLMEKWEVDEMQFAVGMLHAETEVDVTKNGIICVSYASKDPLEAAKITNLIIQELDRVNRGLSISRATDQREFIEERLESAKTDLATAEDSLASFQADNKTILIDAQTRAKIDLIAELQSQRILTQVEYDLLLGSVKSDHPEAVRKRRYLRELSGQISKLEFEADSADTGYVIGTPLAGLHSLSLQLARLTRDVEIQSTVFALLIQQFEHAKLEEKKTTSTISVLDYASVPLLKFKPRRSVIVLGAVLFSLVISLVWIWFIEFIRLTRRTDRERFEKIRSLLDALRVTKFSRSLRSVLSNPDD